MQDAGEQVLHQRGDRVVRRQADAHRAAARRARPSPSSMTSRCACRSCLGFRARREERVPEPGVDAGKPSTQGFSLKVTRVEAARGVAPDLGRRRARRPTAGPDQRDEPAGVGRAPLLDHPVVVRLDAGQAELAVLGLTELLAAEPDHLREAQRRLDMVEVHVLEPGDRVEAAASHLLEADRVEVHLLAAQAHRGDVAADGLDHLVEDPYLGQLAVLVLLGHEGAALVRVLPTRRRS